MTLPTKILVPIDLSPASEEALAYARTLAARVGATIELLHAVDPRGVDGLLGPADPTVWQGVLDRAQARLEALAAAGEAGTVIEGRPADIIIDHAHAARADLVVIGSVGRTGVTRFLLGSVAEEVVRGAPCPVLVVRRGTTSGPSRR